MYWYHVEQFSPVVIRQTWDDVDEAAEGDELGGANAVSVRLLSLVPDWDISCGAVASEGSVVSEGSKVSAEVGVIVSEASESEGEGVISDSTECVRDLAEIV